MLHKSPALHWVVVISKLVAGLTAIFVGLVAFGYSALEWPFLRDNDKLVMGARYVILAAGVIVVIAALWKMIVGCHDCHCTCDKKPGSPYAS